MATTTEIPRLPVNSAHRTRINSLLKQARDALYLLSEERLNLDGESRDTLNEARGAVSVFEFAVENQPTIPDRLTAAQANTFPQGKWS